MALQNLGGLLLTEQTEMKLQLYASDIQNMEPVYTSENTQQNFFVLHKFSSKTWTKNAHHKTKAKHMLQFSDINEKNTRHSKQMHQVATNLESRDCQTNSQQFQPPRVLHAPCSAHPGSCPLCLWWLLGREQHLNTQQWTSVSAMQTSQQNGTGQLIIIIKDICDVPALLRNTTC